MKSLRGESLDAATVTAIGIEGDRSFGLRDVESGTILTARRCPELLFASSLWSAGSVVITLPDGTETDSDETLSKWLRRSVELVPAGLGAGTFENPLDFEDSTDGANESDWVSWDGPDDSFHDSGRTRVSLVSSDTMRAWDEQRFRKNVVLSGSHENDLIDKTLSIGSVELFVTKRVSRCVMVTRPQPEIGRDLDVFKTINRELGGTLGIGTTVTTPGSVEVGDSVTTTRP